MAVEPLELGEEGAVGEIAVDDPDGVAGIERRDQPVAGRRDRLHVPRRDIAGRADQREIALPHRPV